jgi:hypothetical protein
MPIHIRRQPSNASASGPAATAEPARIGNTSTTSPSSAADATALPADAFDAVHPSYRSITHSFGTQMAGYSWNGKDLDAVMKRFCVGDAKELIRTAMALDCGDGILDREELTRAARKETRSMVKGFQWSPTVLADIMTRTGIAEETALLREAKNHDDGNRILEPAELEQAAKVLQNIVGAHDFAAISARIDALKTRSDLEVEKLGEVEGKCIEAIHLPALGGSPPKLSLVVTGGVHGNEPCGAGAAILFLEQLLAHPELREEISVTIVPVVNPRALVMGTRRTPEDVDLNRHFRDGHDAPEEVDILRNMLKERDYDLALDLHSGKAKRNGFWVLHREAEEILKPAFAKFTKEWPVLHRDTAPYTMDTPGIGVSSSSDTLKDLHIENGVKWSVTVEAPGSVSYLDQVLGENDLVHGILTEALKKMA